MRKTFFLFLSLSITNWLLAQKDKDNTTVNSKIEKVTVFIQGAQVERTAKQNLSAGKYTLIFDGISPKIDKQSIQLKSDGKLVILSVTHQINFLKEQQVQDEIKQLDVQKEQLLEKINFEKNMRNVFSQEEQLLLKNQSIKGDNATLKASELKEAADFQRLRLTEVYSKLQENDRNLKKLDAELQKLNKQLTELNQKKDLSTSEVWVAVDVKENAAYNFRLSYLVKEAAWYPTYDVRVQDITHPINLQMKANIRQQSGEDWKDVKLSLSTGDPNDNGTKPTLNPWFLSYYNPLSTTGIRIRGVASIQGDYSSRQVYGVVRNEKGSPVSFATVTAKGTNVATMTDGSGNFTLNMPATSNTIVISSVGYNTQEMNISSGMTSIVLKENTNSLSEVIVTAQGTSAYESDFNFKQEEKDSYKKRKDDGLVTTTTNYQPTTTIFEIENPYTIPTDGKQYTADISSYDVNALYEYYTAPKLDAAAYLTAKVIDWQELNLLPGDANLFFEGTFLGKSFLDVTNAGDTLKLSLGKDKGVVIKRTLLKEYSTKKFLGSNKTDNRQYEISIRNNKQEAITILVDDQFPISTNKDIEIDKLSYDGGKLDDDTKKVTWTFTVESKKETKCKIAYSVKYPKDKTIQLD